MQGLTWDWRAPAGTTVEICWRVLATLNLTLATLSEAIPSTVGSSCLREKYVLITELQLNTLSHLSVISAPHASAKTLIQKRQVILCR